MASDMAALEAAMGSMASKGGRSFDAAGMEGEAEGEAGTVPCPMCMGSGKAPMEEAEKYSTMQGGEAPGGSAPMPGMEG